MGRNIVSRASAPIPGGGGGGGGGGGLVVGPGRLCTYLASYPGPSREGRGYEASTYCAFFCTYCAIYAQVLSGLPIVLLFRHLLCSNYAEWHNSNSLLYKLRLTVCHNNQLEITQMSQIRCSDESDQTLR